MLEPIEPFIWVGMTLIFGLTLGLGWGFSVFWRWVTGDEDTEA